MLLWEEIVQPGATWSHAGVDRVENDRYSRRRERGCYFHNFDIRERYNMPTL
jgi:hypothetical protein